MRFGFFDQPGHHPILVAGNTNSRYSFWDLQRLEEGVDIGSFSEEAPPASKAKGKGRARPSVARGAGSAFSALPDLAREESLASNTSSGEFDDHFILSYPNRSRCYFSRMAR